MSTEIIYCINRSLIERLIKKDIVVNENMHSYSNNLDDFNLLITYFNDGYISAAADTSYMFLRGKRFNYTPEQIKILIYKDFEKYLNEQYNENFYKTN